MSTSIALPEIVTFTLLNNPMYVPFTGYDTSLLGWTNMYISTHTFQRVTHQHTRARGSTSTTHVPEGNTSAHTRDRG